MHRLRRPALGDAAGARRLATGLPRRIAAGPAPSAWLVIGFAAVFYPLALGLGPFRPLCAIGYQPWPLLLACGALAAALWRWRRNDWLLILALALAGYAGGLFANLWTPWSTRCWCWWRSLSPSGSWPEASRRRNRRLKQPQFRRSATSVTRWPQRLAVSRSPWGISSTAASDGERTSRPTG